MKYTPRLVLTLALLGLLGCQPSKPTPAQPTVTATLLRDFPPSEQISNMDFSPDGKKLVMTTLASEVKNEAILRDVNTGAEIRRINGQVPYVYFAPDGKSLIGIEEHSGSTVMCRWKVAGTGATLKAPLPATPMAISRQPGRMLCVNRKSKQVEIFDTDTGRKLRAIPMDGEVYAAGLSRDAKLAAAGLQTPRANLRVYETATGRERLRIDAHQGAVWSVGFSIKGDTLASGGGDATAAVWDVQTGKELCRVREKTQIVGWAWFSPDGRRLLTRADTPVGGGAEIGTVLSLWDTANSRRLATIPDVTWEATMFSRDSRLLVTGHQKGAVTFWDLKTGSTMGTILAGHGEAKPRISPDGKTLAVSYGYGRQEDEAVVKLWRLAY